jgi:hypothetical protein
MPDFDQIRAQLNAKGAGRACPACGVNDWIFGAENALLQAVADDFTVQAIGRGYGLVPVICGNCGYVRLHNLDVLTR